MNFRDFLKEAEEKGGDIIKGETSLPPGVMKFVQSNINNQNPKNSKLNASPSEVSPNFNPIARDALRSQRVTSQSKAKEAGYRGVAGPTPTNAGGATSGGGGATGGSGSKSYSSNTNTVLTWAREAKSGKNKVNPGISSQLNALMTQYDIVKNDKSPSGKARKEQIVKQIGVLQQQSRSPEKVSAPKPSNTIAGAPNPATGATPASRPHLNLTSKKPAAAGGNAFAKQQYDSILTDSGLFAGTPKGDSLRKGAEWMNISDATKMNPSELKKRMILDIAANERSDMAIHSLSTLARLNQIPEYKLQDNDSKKLSFHVARRYAKDSKFSNFIDSLISQHISNSDMTSNWKKQSDSLKAIILTQKEGSQEYKDALLNLSKLMAMSLMKPANENSHSETLRDVKIETQRIKDYIQKRSGGELQTQTQTARSTRTKNPTTLKEPKDIVPGRVTSAATTQVGTGPSTSTGTSAPIGPSVGNSRRTSGQTSGSTSSQTSGSTSTQPSVSPQVARAASQVGRVGLGALSALGSALAAPTKREKARAAKQKNLPSNAPDKTKENFDIKRELAGLNKKIQQLAARLKFLFKKLKTGQNLSKSDRAHIRSEINSIERMLETLNNRKTEFVRQLNYNYGITEELTYTEYYARMLSEHLKN